MSYGWDEDDVGWVVPRTRSRRIQVEGQARGVADRAGWVDRVLRSPCKLQEVAVARTVADMMIMREEEFGWRWNAEGKKSMAKTGRVGKR